MERTIQFRETTLKTLRIEGKNDEEIQKKMEYYKENPELIDFDKEPDSYVVDAVFYG